MIEDSRSFFQTLQDEVNANPNGYSAKQLADWLGKSYSTFMNELNDDIETHKFGVSSWRKLISRMGGSRTIDLICEENGGIFVDLNGIKTGPAALQIGLSDIIEKVSNTMRDFGKSTSPDSDGGTEITKKEAEQLIRDCNVSIAAIETFKRAIEASQEDRK